MANTLMVDYDLNAPGQKYDDLIAYLKTHSPRIKPLRSTWMVITDKTARQVRDEILRIVDDNDNVLVVDVTNDAMAWIGLTDPQSAWIKNRRDKVAA